MGFSPWFTRSEFADDPSWTGLNVPTDWTQYPIRQASDADMIDIGKAVQQNELHTDWTQYPYDVPSYADGDGLFSNHENANNKATANPDSQEYPGGADR
jgi:hypothetical protein